MTWILNHIDCFVSQSRGNAVVVFYPFAVDGQDDEVWDKVGEAIGNLQVLKSLGISTYDSDDYDYDEYEQLVLNSKWEILARILSHVRQNVGINLDEHDLAVEELQMLTLARALWTPYDYKF
jgi:hypothetical protein